MSCLIFSSDSEPYSEIEYTLFHSKQFWQTIAICHSMEIPDEQGINKAVFL